MLKTMLYDALPVVRATSFAFLIILIIFAFARISISDRWLRMRSSSIMWSELTLDVFLLTGRAVIQRRISMILSKQV